MQLAELYRRAKLIKHAYDQNFQTTLEMPTPQVNIFPDEDKVTLWWNGNAESYESVDPFLTGQNYSDSTYNLRVTGFGSLGTQPELMDG